MIYMHINFLQVSLFLLADLAISDFLWLPIIYPQPLTSQSKTLYLTKNNSDRSTACITFIILSIESYLMTEITVVC